MIQVQGLVKQTCSNFMIGIEVLLLFSKKASEDLG